MKVFLFEHLCGGITPQDAENMPTSLLRQGGAMLRAVAEDFLALDVEVTTMLHSRAGCDGGGMKVIPVLNNSPIEKMFDEQVAAADAVLIIAPECEDILGEWLDRVEKVGGESLGVTAAAARLCGDKLRLAHHLNVVNVPTPVTQTYDGKSTSLPFPVVVKPRYGVGCEDTFVCRGEEDLAGLKVEGEMIVQTFAPGLDASCSLIVHGTTVRVLPAGEQFIHGDATLTYRGGRVPLEKKFLERAARLANDAAAWIPGVKGFIGVDLVLGDRPEDDCVIEINPRLTMSYVALRQMCATNLAAAMLDPDAELRWHEQSMRFDADGAVERELRI